MRNRFVNIDHVTVSMILKLSRKARIIEEVLCDNCGLCVDACPYSSEGKIIFPHPSKDFFIKCDLCYKLEGGPACTEICPTQALTNRIIRGKQK